MNLAAQSGMLAAFVSAAVALSVLLRNRKPLVNRLFVLFAGNLFVHFLASFFHRFSESAGWLKVDLFSVNLLPVTSLLFFSHFLWKGTEVTRPYLRLMLGCSVVGTAMLLLLPAQHPLLIYFIICFAFTGLYICVWLFRLRRRELRSQREKTRLKILQLVMLVAVTFVLLGMLPAPFGFLRTWGDLVSVFFLYFLSQGLIRYRLLDLQELLGRGLVLIAIALILAIVFGLLVLLAGAAPPVSLFHTFVASFIILILFEPLRDKVEDSAGLLLFRERFELRRQLQQLRRSIANIIDVEAMAAVMLDTLYENLKLAGSSIYLREEASDSFQLLAFRGPRPPERLVRNSHPEFFEQLERTPTVILAESFERVLEQHGISADEEVPDKVRHAGKVLDTLHRLRAGICLPLVVQGRVLGLWNILDEAGTASYSSDEIALFMAVAEQAAINIANSKLFERMRERDRLAVLGEMAAGLAHEIRNPLGAIKGAAQYLDPAEVGKEAGEFLGIIVEECNRLNRVVDQFLDYARPLKSNMEPADMNTLVANACRVFTTGRDMSGLELKLELAEELPAVDADPQQITQVLLNLLGNAADAMNGSGTIIVKTRSSIDASEGRRVEIVVSDTGPGIPPELRQKIFVPFFTTKENGTGLGLAICQRIVEGHRGQLLVRSAPGAGTTFTISLPAPEKPTPAHPEP